MKDKMDLSILTNSQINCSKLNTIVMNMYEMNRRHLTLNTEIEIYTDARTVKEVRNFVLVFVIFLMFI